MKKYLFSLLMIVPFLSGCESLSELTQFDLPFTQSVTVPPISTEFLALGMPITLSTPEIETDIDSVLGSYGVETDFVEKIALKEMTFTVSSPSGEDLSFLDDVTIYLTASGAEDVKVASATDVSTTTPLTLTIENVDLKNYLLKDKFALKIKATADEATTVEHKVDISMKFGFDIKVLGL